MAVIENAGAPDAVVRWEAAMRQMTAAELLAQQVCQRGAEHALAELQKLGATPENCQAMLDSLRHALISIHEIANERGIRLLSYIDEDEASGDPGGGA